MVPWQQVGWGHQGFGVHNCDSWAQLTKRMSHTIWEPICMNLPIQVTKTTMKPQQKSKEYIYFIPSLTMPGGTDTWGHRLRLVQLILASSRMGASRLPHYNKRLWACLWECATSQSMQRMSNTTHYKWNFAKTTLLAFPAARSLWTKLFSPPSQIFWF